MVPTISLINIILVGVNEQIVFAEVVAVATGIGLTTTVVVATIGEHPLVAAIV